MYFNKELAQSHQIPSSLGPRLRHAGPTTLLPEMSRPN